MCTKVVNQISDYNVISPGSSLVKMVRLLSVELSTRMVPLPLPQFKNQAIMRVRLIAQNVLKTFKHIRSE